MIRRGPRPTQNFTVIRNEVGLDSRLSYRARGVLIAILVRPDNWQTSAQSLSRHGSEGRDAVRNALLELETAGYLIRRKIRNKDGTFSAEAVVYDFPQVRPAPENPTPDNQASENQASDFQAPLQRQKVRTDNKTKTQGFDDFWILYPRRVGKGAARKSWARALEKATAEEILQGVRRYSAARLGQDQAFTAHPATWLNHERWTDEIIEPEPEPTPREPRPFCGDCRNGFLTEIDDDGNEFAYHCPCQL